MQWIRSPLAHLAFLSIYGFIHLYLFIVLTISFFLVSYNCLDLAQVSMTFLSLSSDWTNRKKGHFKFMESQFVNKEKGLCTVRQFPTYMAAPLFSFWCLSTFINNLLYQLSIVFVYQFQTACCEYDGHFLFKCLIHKAKKCIPWELNYLLVELAEGLKLFCLNTRYFWNTFSIVVYSLA